MERDLTLPRWQDLPDIDSLAGHLVSCAATLHGTDRALLMLLDEDRKSLHAWDAIWPKSERRALLGKRIEIDEEKGIVARVVREGRSLVSPPGATGDLPIRIAARQRVAVVPVRGRDQAIGVLILPDGSTGGNAEESLRRIEEIAHEAAGALERLRVERESALAAERLGRILDHQRRIGGASRVEEVLRMTSKVAGEGVRAAFTGVWTGDGSQSPPQLVASFGALAGSPDDRLAAISMRVSEALAGRAAFRGRVVAGGQEFAGLIALMRVFDEVHGVIACVEKSRSHRLEPHLFTADDETFLESVALQTGMAIENARLAEAHRADDRAMAEARMSLLRQERLVALGEMSLHFAREARGSLAAMRAAVERLGLEASAEEPLRDAAALILLETRRLEEELAEQVAFGQAAPLRLEIADLAALVRTGLDAIRDDLEARGVRLLEINESRIPPMLLDSARVRQLLANILSNAAAATRPGSKIRVRTRAAEGWAQVEIAHEGEAPPGEAIEQLFVPFTSAGRPGGPLGLGIVDRIVREHGGEVRVRSDPEYSAVFTVSLPVRTNQDRRRSRERRGGRDRRRAA